MFSRTLVTFTLLLATLFAAPAQEGETISAFDVRIEIDPEDASLFVTETITVNATGDKIKRGIYRDFPTLNKGPFGLRLPVTFDVISVLRDGEPENFVVEGLQDGKRIRIGNKDKKLPRGTYTYVIDYRTGGQLRTFSTYDELYWNATGHGWDFPISRTRVTAVLPTGTEIIVDDDARPSAYLGKPGAGENEADYEYSEQGNGTAVFQSRRTIRPGEGLTVAVPFTKGTVNHPSVDVSLLKENWAFILGFLLVVGAVVYHFGAWVAAGRDPEAGMVHTQLEPPENFSPAACRYLKQMGFDNRCFAAAVVGLASKNALRITGDVGSGFVLRHPDSELERAHLTKDEAALAKELLHNRESLALERTSHNQISAARDTLKSELATLLEKTHFVRNLHLWVPGLLATLVGVALSLFNASLPPVAFFLAVWLTVWTAGCAFLVSSVISAIRDKRWGSAVGFSLFSLPFLGGWIAGFAMFSQTASWASVALLAVGVAVNILFYHLIKAPTHAGRDVLDEIGGFEKFLDDVSPGSPVTSDTYSRYLAYAIALDHEKQWSNRFAAALGDASSAGASPSRFHHPHWYTGSMAASSFGSAIGSSLTSSLASSAQSPSSSSGSSGGGSSGGGGGGGGGGGW